MELKDLPQLTQKQQHFVLSVLAGDSMDVAAKRAGYGLKPKAILKNKAIVDALNFAKPSQQNSQENNVNQPQNPLDMFCTKDSHMAQLAHIRDLAIEAKKFNDAIKAEELRGTVAGLYDRKRWWDDPTPTVVQSRETLTLTLDRLRELGVVNMAENLGSQNLVPATIENGELKNEIP